MITDFGDGRIAYFCCISAFREKVVVPTVRVTGFSPTWFVAKGQYDLYKASGGEEVIESGGIIESRNLALEIASATNTPVLMMDDELSRVQEPVFSLEKQKYIPSPISFKEGVCRMFDGFKVFPDAHLAGIAPTDNPFFFQGSPVNGKAFVMASCMLIKPSKLRFDPLALLKEDYDFTIQNVLEFGCVARRDDVLMSFAHKSKTGGVSSWRTVDKNNEAIAYIAKKWGGRFMRPNTKRPGEIILKF